MKGLKLDTSKIVGQTAGAAAGLVAVKGLKKIGFVAKQKPMIQGLINIVAGLVVLPFAAKKMGLAGKKGSNLIAGAEGALVTCGVAQLGSAIPVIGGAFPTIGGYEENPYTMQGLEMQDNENNMNGADYEESVNAAEDDVYM